MTYLRISNQRCHYYVSSEGVSLSDLAHLWIGLSRIGYYQLSEHLFDVSSPVDNKIIFDSLASFKKFKKI